MDGKENITDDNQQVAPEETETVVAEAGAPSEVTPQLVHPHDGSIDSLRVYREEEFLQRPYRPRSTHWSIAWSDLMMTMFILFAVLYIYQLSNHTFEDKWKESLRMNVTVTPGTSGPSTSGGPGDMTDADIQSTGEIFNLSRKIIKTEDLEDFADVDLAPDQSIRFTMTNDLLFDLGMADVKPGARRGLSGVSQVILKTPFMINIVGHTDSSPISSDRYPSNWELSVARATSVARFMIDELQVPAKRIFVTGHSYFQPLRDNDTPENRAINRRVEIIITKDKPSY